MLKMLIGLAMTVLASTAFAGNENSSPLRCGVSLAKGSSANTFDDGREAIDADTLYAMRTGNPLVGMLGSDTSGVYRMALQTLSRVERDFHFDPSIHRSPATDELGGDKRLPLTVMIARLGCTW